MSSAAAETTDQLASLPATITVRYWAAAREASGTDSEELPLDHAASVEVVLARSVATHPGLGPVLRVASVLLDGVRAERGQPVPAGSVLEVLPPFAGG